MVPVNIFAPDTMKCPEMLFMQLYLTIQSTPRPLSFVRKPLANFFLTHGHIRRQSCDKATRREGACRIQTHELLPRLCVKGGAQVLFFWSHLPLRRCFRNSSHRPQCLLFVYECTRMFGTTRHPQPLRKHFLCLRSAQVHVEPIVLRILQNFSISTTLHVAEHVVCAVAVDCSFSVIIKCCVCKATNIYRNSIFVNSICGKMN